MKGGWRVMRMDDHGRVYLVQRFDSLQSANESLRQINDAGKSPYGEGHKQLYFIKSTHDEEAPS